MILRGSLDTPFLLLDAVLHAGARLLRAVLNLDADVVRKLVTQRDHLTRLEQPHPIAQVQPRREVFADGQRRTTDHVVLLDASLIEPEPLADALGDQPSGTAFQRL